MAKKFESNTKSLLKHPIAQMEPWFDKAETEAVGNYMKSGGWIMEFDKTRELEEMIADYTGAKYCVMTVNGTLSLVVALLALGIHSGDEVLMPNFTMIASPNAASLLGAKPILVDVEPTTLCMDLDKAKKSLTKKTRVLMYVAVNGRSTNMKDVVKFCTHHSLFLLEDAAQALGSFFKGKHLGTFGDIGSFSLSVPKIITTGQGGVLVTNSAKYFEKIRKIKDFGRTSGGTDLHDEWGWNFKYTDLQAVIGIEQMKKLALRVKRKKEIFERYRQGLKNLPEVEILRTDLSDTSPWFIDIFVKDPDKLAFFLKTRGIGTRIVYPPISSQKIYMNANNSTKFPVTQKYTSRGIWLPSSSRLTDKEVDIVVNFIKEYYTQKVPA